MSELQAGVVPLARRIDISAVQAYHDERDIRALSRAARQGGYVSAHVLPNWVPLMRELLAGSDTLVGAPVGFPSGGAATEVKVAEALRLLADGAQEMDVVINIGRLRSGHDTYVRDDLAEVTGTVAGTVPVKVILETCYLNEDQVRKGCDLAIDAGADFVKTGTGWSGGSTSVEVIKLIRRHVGDAIGIKASGGIRDLDTVLAMLRLGVTRFGINARSAREIVDAYDRHAASSGAGTER